MRLWSLVSFFYHTFLPITTSLSPSLSNNLSLTTPGLASVRMELILLLQELQQERTTRKQLTSPLPFPTTLPLLSSSIARTVIVNPIRHIENMTSDLLRSTAAMKSPPSLGDCPVVIEKVSQCISTIDQFTPSIYL